MGVDARAALKSRFSPGKCCLIVEALRVRFGLTQAALRAALQVILTGSQPIQQQLQISHLHMTLP